MAMDDPERRTMSLENFRDPLRDTASMGSVGDEPHRDARSRLDIAIRQCVRRLATLDQAHSSPTS
jgi:hypothetical protein